ncbi:MAG: hypothetical protein H0U66_06500 [Gemmatimonadaceae bacterium]|nr:hypothetical protein [Gemmatimonadaceae bacterium]
MIDSGFPPIRPRFGWPEALILAATAFELAVALLAHHFPYTDPTNHLARYDLIARIWFGDPAGYVVMHWVPTSYIAGDIIGALSVHFLGAVATLRLINFTSLVLLPLGLYFLLLSAAPAQRGWALVGVLFGFSSHLLFGYLNYALGVGLVFCWLALWYPRRANASWLARIALSLGAIALFLVHLTAPLLVLVVIFTDWGLAVIGENELLPSKQWKIFDSRLPTILCVLAAVAIVWAGASYSSWNDVGPEGEYIFRPLGNKLIAFTSPFYSVSIVAAAVISLGWLASLAAMVYARRGAYKLDSLSASAVIMFVLYLIFPKSIPGAGAVDIRWLWGGYLLLFCARQRGPEREPRMLLLVPFAACVLHTSVIGYTARKIDRDLDQYQAALAHVPAGTNLLPLGDGVKMYGRVQVMRHFVLWHELVGHGRAPGLFNYRDASEQDPLNHHLAHFIEPAHLYLADSEWGEPDFMPALPWTRIDDEYDYILQTAGGMRVSSYVKKHADEIWADEPFVLYKVRKP